MTVLVCPPDRNGWESKKALLRDIIAGKSSPPFLYDDILFLVPSARVRRFYLGVLLELSRSLHGAGSIVPPDIQTFHRFLLKEGMRPGRMLVDENSRLVLLEGIVKQFVSRNAALGSHADVLSPSLAASVAEMIEELSFAGVDVRGLSEAAGSAGMDGKPAVELLLGAFERYGELMERKGLCDPAGIFAGAAERFDQRSLERYSRVIIDGIHDANELQCRILRAISATGKCTFLVDAPSPELIRDAREYHPLALTREFLARLGLLPGTASAEMSPDDRSLSEMLFSGGTFDEAARGAPSPPECSKDVRLLSAVNMREEVTRIAFDVKDSLRRGAVPGSVLVAFPSLDEYGTLVEEIFNDYGIPYNRALGRQLGVSPVAAAVISMLRPVQDGFTGPSLLRVFSSPFLKCGDAPQAAAALDRIMREFRITGGRENWLAAAKRAGSTDGPDLMEGPLSDLFGALEPFGNGGSASLAVWMERLAKLISWSGLGERVKRIRGPLNVNLQAFRKLQETNASLASAGGLFPEFRYSFSEWSFLLRKTYLRTRFQAPAPDEGGVQVLGIEESSGLPWDEVYLGGLVEGAYPQRRPQNIFLPEAALERLGIRTLEKTRLSAAHHFYRMLLSAPRVTLTWPENQGEKPAAPSPFIAELVPLAAAGMLNRGIEVTRGISHSLAVADCRSLPELSKSLALSGTARGLEPVLTAGAERTAGIAAALASRPPAPSMRVDIPRKTSFRVTELDDYLSCPYDYYVKHVLGIEPLGEVTEDISAADRGSKVHAILRDFYLSWKEPVLAGARIRAEELLRSIAEKSFSLEADTFRNRKEKDLFLHRMAGRFLDAEEAFWMQGMRPVYLEHKIEFFTIDLPDGITVELHAKIDRIDADESGNFVIVDYKTGSYPLPRTGVEQDIFQLPVYAVMARQVRAGKSSALVKPVGLAYYDLAGKYGAHARDVVLYDKEARNDHPATKPIASAKSAVEFEQILQASIGKVKQAAAGILAGEFPVKPINENKCRFCTNTALCGKKL